MSTRIMTLFGEEIVPEPQKPAGRTRAKKAEDAEAVDSQQVQAEGAATATTETSPTPAVNEAVATNAAAVIADTAVDAAAEAPLTQVENEVVVTEATTEIPDTTVEAPPPPVENEMAATDAPVAEVQEVVAHQEVVTEQDVVAEVTQTEEVAAIDETLPDAAIAEKPAVKKTEKKPKKEITAADAESGGSADIIPEDWKGEKTYYTIGEVAEFFKVKTSHIRFWTNEFKLKVRTTRKGDRLFTPEQVKELRAIYHLVKGRGFTLSGAKAKLKTQNKRDVTTVDLRTSLLQLKDKLVILREQLV